MSDIDATPATPEETVAQFNAWLSRNGNGDAPCSCGHLLGRHRVDLAGCSDCDSCAGFNLDRGNA